MPSEKELVKRLKNHDPEAFGKLYDLYFDRIYNYIYWRVGNQPDSEDLTEQVFLKALETIDKYKWRGAPISAWLFQIARNLVIDRYRAKKGGLIKLDEAAVAAKEDSTSTEEAVLEQIGRQDLREAIAKLTEEQQQVVVLKFFAGFSNTEVSKILSKPVGAIKSLQHRALASLARILKERGRNE